MDSLVLLLITACLIYNSLLALIVDDSADLPSLIQIDGNSYARTHRIQLRLSVLLGRGKPTVLLVDLD